MLSDKEKNERVFIEIAYSQLQKKGMVVCGDTFLSRKIKGENRFVAVLSDGLGSGIRANVLSGLTASMALNYRLRHEPLLPSIVSIMNTLPVDSVRGISYATCSIVEIDYHGQSEIVEFDAPEYILLRGDKHFEPKKETITLDTTQGQRTFLHSHLMLFKGDRLILMSDGVTQSGMGMKDYPFGWGRDKVIEYVEQILKTDPNISAKALSKLVLTESRKNDIMKPKDDITCAVVYLRAPRRLLICTGPPYAEEKDNVLAQTVENYPGRRIVCGGTTSKIISRELKREISIDLARALRSKLPPSAQMEGVDLVTEGILTLGQLITIIEQYTDDSTIEDSPAGDIMRMILESDVIEFIVGTRINEAHQDPNLPVELEIRRNVVKRISDPLEERFLKKVNVRYI